MKKSLKLAVAASVLATPALAGNVENPLYMPTAGEFYSKTSAGLMVKIADHSVAHEKRDTPVIRNFQFGVSKKT